MWKCDRTKALFCGLLAAIVLACGLFTADPEHDPLDSRPEGQGSAHGSFPTRLPAKGNESAHPASSERSVVLPLVGEVRTSVQTQRVEYMGSGKDFAKDFRIYSAKDTGWVHCEWGEPISQLQPSSAKEIEEEFTRGGDRYLGIPNKRCEITLGEVLGIISRSTDLSAAKRLEVSYIVLQKVEKEAVPVVLFKAWGVEGPWFNTYSEALWGILYPGTDRVELSSMGPEVIRGPQ